jgi:hypothetical protein
MVKKFCQLPWHFFVFCTNIRSTKTFVFAMLYRKLFLHIRKEYSIIPADFIYTEKAMKKLLALLLALALVLSLCGCFAPSSMQAPTLPEDSVPTQAPTQEPTEEPTDVLVEFPTQEPTEEPTEEETIYDPRPHPSDIPTEPEDTRPRPTEPDYSQETQPTQPTEAPTESPTEAPTEPPTEAPTEPPIDQYSYYTSKDKVALYIATYGWLPGNYISKEEGNRLYGSYKNIPSSMNIGGDRFMNREGLLPSGYTYYECDIGTAGGRNRGSLRLVFTTSGIVYYTSDHYRSFTRLY